jgi:cell division protein FtsI (penicillin-binding protein 3)
VTVEARANGALQNIYEPGSTFKIVAYSAAIDKASVKPDDRIDCQMGSITVAGRLIHDHHPFGVLTVAEALAKSSNVGAIKLGLKVGDQSMYDFIQRFGFGSRTGVERPEKLRESCARLVAGSRHRSASIAMGQEVGVTPLQMAAAFTTVANSGVRVAPHLVREIRTPGGAVIQRTSPEQHRVISAETATQLKGMLEGVTLRGTAKKAQLDGYTAAGKRERLRIDPRTKGYSKTKYVASFVGFAPVEHPAVVIIVVIDEPAGSHHGRCCGASVSRHR